MPRCSTRGCDSPANPDLPQALPLCTDCAEARLDKQHNPSAIPWIVAIFIAGLTLWVAL